ncbi:2'-5' RNA ligase family protein [Williamsia sp. M5A3_1d]
MAHSIELLMDPRTDEAVRRVWSALIDADLPSQGHHRSSSNRPHITMIAADLIDPGVDRALASLGDRLPLAVDLGGTVVFRGGRSTVARLVVATRDLLALHRDVVAITTDFVEGQMFAHCEPDHWTPHVTVARRVRDDQVGRCIAVADDASRSVPWTPIITGIRRWDGDARESVDLVNVS